MDTIDRGRVLALTLDAVDPRQDSGTRLAATETAADTDIRLAFTYTRGMTYGLLDFIRHRHGEDVLAAVVAKLADRCMIVLDAEGDGDA